MKRLLFCLSIILSLITLQTYACTRFILTDPKGVMVGRTMDWEGDMPTNLVVYPRGIAHDGLASGNSLKWVSKYASIGATAFDIAATEGMNEKGFTAHVLWLEESNYGERDLAIPGMSIMFWPQFYIDNFATVAEAVRYTETTPMQLIPLYNPQTGHWLNLHLAIEDASGDSAIIEYIDGKVQVYHNKSYTVLTNSPTYDKQLLNLKQYQSFGGDKVLPGTTESPDRFVRAAYYSSNMSPAATERDMVAKVNSVIDTISSPPGVSKESRPVISQTLWRSISDLTHGVYYFKAANRYSMIYVPLNKFNLRAGAPVMKLDLVNSNELSGDVTRLFKPLD